MADTANVDCAAETANNRDNQVRKMERESERERERKREKEKEK